MVKFSEEQKSIINAARSNILVSAAAGSGKTTVLAQRITSKIINHELGIDELLVVTFTKDAASHMREKIESSLRKALNEEGADRKYIKSQIDKVPGAYIQTMNSFCNRVVSEAGHMSEDSDVMEPGSAVLDDTTLKILRKQSANEAVMAVYEAIAQDGVSDGEREDFLNLVFSMGDGKNEGPVAEAVDEAYLKLRSLPDYLEIIDGVIANRERTDADGIIVGLSQYIEMYDDLIRKADSACDGCGSYLDNMNLPDKYKLPVRAIIESVRRLSAEYIERFDACSDDKGRRDVIDNFFADFYNNSDPSDYKRLYTSSDNKDLHFLKIFGPIAALCVINLQSHKNAGDKVSAQWGFNDSAAPYKLNPDFDVIGTIASDDLMVLQKRRTSCARAFASLLKDMDARYSVHKKRLRGIDFSDQEHMCLRVLKTPEINNLFKNKFKEIYIDEYQDNTSLQDAVVALIANNNVFCVGDVKQSIYKFRLARPEIFMEKLGTYDKGVTAKDRRIDLHKNFRSRKEVLEATNYIFEKIMGPDLGSVDYDEDARLVTGAEYPEPTYGVSPELIMFDSNSDNEALSNYDAREKEALVIAERIHQLREEDPNLQYKDIVILLRSLSGWDDVFKKILEDQGIPTYIESKSGYFEAYEVAVILELLTIIDNPSQDIPLVSVMHSPIGGFTDEDLARLRVMVDSDEKAALEDSFYYGLKGLARNRASSRECEEITTGSVVEQSDADRQEGTNKESEIERVIHDISYGDDKVILKLVHFIDFVEDLRTLSVYTPVHELLQHILDETGFDKYCLAMPAGNQRKANLDQLLSRALSFEKTSFKGLFHFVRYIEHMKLVDVDYGEAGIIDENADVVRIMSIHKSKGLEFPVVFVSGLTKGFNKMDTQGDLIADMDLGIGVKCINSELRVKYDTLKRLIVADKMITDSLGEELRVLYVALTRAKEKLILTAAVKKLFDKVGKAIRSLPTILGKDKLLPYSVRAGAENYFDLVLSSVLRRPEFAKAVGALEIPEDLFKGYIEAEVPDFSFIFLQDEKIAGDMLKREVLGSSKRQELMDGIRTYQGDLASRLKEKFDAQYPYEYLKGLFTKTTVTELKKHKLEEMGEVFGHSADYAQDRDDDLIVTDMQGEMSGDTEANAENADRKPVKRLTGAERGTAYHRIMEILDEDIFGSEDLMGEAEKSRSVVPNDDAGKIKELDDVSRKVYAWMCEQHKKGMIPEEYLSCVWSPDVTAFLSSELGQRMGRAYRRGELVREKPFMMGIPASDLDNKYPSDEMVLIQGIIDAWFIEDGQIVLMDYKTDKVSEGQELIDRYSIQLELYKRALESVTDMKVKEVLIYAFALSETIKLF